jgi:uncharacterized membrane protein
MSAICPYNRSRRCHEWFSRTFAAPIIRGSGMWVKAASVLLGTAAVVGATPAKAALTFCNKSPSSLDLAYAYSQKDAEGTSTGGHRGVVARGWFTIARGGCRKVDNLDASNHWLYVYAEGTNRKLEGPTKLCVRNAEFIIGQQFRSPCTNSEHYLAGFRLIQSNAKNFTFTIN